MGIERKESSYLNNKILINNNKIMKVLRHMSAGYGWTNTVLHQEQKGANINVGEIIETDEDVENAIRSQDKY